MKPEGLRAFNLRKEEKSKVYSHEKEPAELTPELKNQFEANKVAWEFFMNQAPSYRKVIVHWIISAKQEKTRQSRLEKTIEASSQLQRME